MVRRVCCCLPALLVIHSLCGCSPLGMAKRGLKELRGAHGKVVPVRDAAASFYAGLSGIDVGEVTNSIHPVCSAEMHSMIETALRAEAAGAASELQGSGGACTVDLDVSFHKPPGGALALLGKGALLIGRANVRDNQNESQADLLVVVSSEAMRTGRQEMADVFAQTLIGHLCSGGD